jgi:hypothetical protein
MGNTLDGSLKHERIKTSRITFICTGRQTTGACEKIVGHKNEDSSSCRFYNSDVVGFLRLVISWPWKKKMGSSLLLTHVRIKYYMLHENIGDVRSERSWRATSFDTIDFEEVNIVDEKGGV